MGASVPTYESARARAGAARRSPFIRAQDRVIVLDQRDLHRRGEVFRVRIAQAGSPADAGNDAIDELQVRPEELFWTHLLEGTAKSIRPNVCKAGRKTTPLS